MIGTSIPGELVRERAHEDAFAGRAAAEDDALVDRGAVDASNWAGGKDLKCLAQVERGRGAARWRAADADHAEHAYSGTAVVRDLASRAAGEQAVPPPGVGDEDPEQGSAHGVERAAAEPVGAEHPRLVHVAPGVGLRARQLADAHATLQ
jgi:hypothetical protein